MSVEKYAEYFLNFKVNDLNFIYTFDTTFFVCILLNEGKIESKRIKSSLQIDIFNYIKKIRNKIIILDTIFVEFNEIIRRKLDLVEDQIYNYLKEANKRIKNGEKDTVVIIEYKEKLKSNPHINTFYLYLDDEGYSFYYLLDKKKRLDFQRNLESTKRRLINSFRTFTSPFTIKFVNEEIIKWYIKDRKYLQKFEKITPKIGKKDRFHLIGSMIFSLKELQNISFTTTDSEILNLSKDITNFYDENKTEINKQIKLLTS